MWINFTCLNKTLLYSLPLWTVGLKQILRSHFSPINSLQKALWRNLFLSFRISDHIFVIFVRNTLSTKKQQNMHLCPNYLIDLVHEPCPSYWFWQLCQSLNPAHLTTQEQCGGGGEPLPAGLHAPLPGHHGGQGHQDPSGNRQTQMGKKKTIKSAKSL